MLKEKFVLFLVTVSALLLSASAAFFSVYGLSKVFAGAGISVIIMASVLEGSKLIAAYSLHQNKDILPTSLKTYLSIAIVVLMLITSAGIYGFLSNAYHQTSIEYNLTKTSTDSLINKKSSFEFQITNLNKQLELKNTQLEGLNSNSKTSDQVLSTLAFNNRNINSMSRSSTRTQKEISKLNSNIDIILNKITVLQDSVYAYDIAIKGSALNASKKSELGPLEYLSGILNTDMDKVVNWFILLFVIVFDPLAMALLIAYNFLAKKDNIDLIDENTKEILIINEPMNTVLDELLTTETVEQSTIIQEEEKLVIHKDTPVIDNEFLDTESIYEESKTNKPIDIKKPNKIGYSGGISK